MTTADLPSLAGLRQRAGATQTELDAWELENGCKPTDPLLIARHNALLEQNEESSRWLRVAESQITGKMNFLPTNFPRTKKATKPKQQPQLKLNQ